MTTSLTDQQLAAIRARFERSTHPDWRDSTDVGRLLAELGRVRAELTTTQAELRREVRQHGQTINERDHATDMADRLAAAIASEDVIGEHSGGNCPWTNALNYASEQAHLAEQQAAASVPSA